MSTSARPRIGLILPSVQVVTEPLFNEIAGATCDFVATRLPLEGTGVADLIEMESSLPGAVKQLASAHVDIMVSCCTVSGAVKGYDGDRELCGRFEADTRIPMTTTMLSVVDALRHAGSRTLTVVTPYPDELNVVERTYLENNGFRVLAEAGQGIGDGYQISGVAPEVILEFARANWHPDSDALFLSCMNWPAARAVGRLQSEVSDTVVTSHTATLWNALRLVGAKVPADKLGFWAR